MNTIPDSDEVATVTVPLDVRFVSRKRFLNKAILRHQKLDRDTEQSTAVLSEKVYYKTCGRRECTKRVHALHHCVQYTSVHCTVWKAVMKKTYILKWDL